MQTVIKQPLTNVQLLLLNVFSHELSDEDYIELRKVLVNFFSDKLVKIADKAWEDNNWNDEEVEKMLNTKMRSSSIKKVG